MPRDRSLETINGWTQEVGIWRERTFGHSTTESTIEHLRREVVELREAAESDGAISPYFAYELADCLMLIMGLAHMHRINLCDALSAKFQHNLNRDWGTRDADGIVEHVRTPEEAARKAKPPAVITTTPGGGLQIACSASRKCGACGFTLDDDEPDGGPCRTCREAGWKRTS